MTRVPFHTKVLAGASKFHRRESLAKIKIIVVLMEATQAHTITIIIHLLTEHQGAARVPPPPLTGAQAVAMITKSLPTNPLAGRTAAAIRTDPDMRLLTRLAAMRGRAMVARVETAERMRKNPADMDTNLNVWRSSLRAVSTCDRGGVLG